MASSEPPPAYPGIGTPSADCHDKEFVMARFRFPHGVLGGGTLPTVKIFAEDYFLDDISPELQKMFPRGNMRIVRKEHVVRVDMGYNAIEYWQMQVFKMISARGFIMRTSHTSGLVKEKTNSVTYTFAR